MPRGYGQLRRGSHPVAVLTRLMRHMEPEPNSGCWLWTGQTIGTGYGRLEVGPQVNYRRARKVLAHRAMWAETSGGIPPDRDVLHRCDQPACINPQHLWLGTHSENMRDAMRKGRRVLSKNARGHFVAGEARG